MSNDAGGCLSRETIDAYHAKDLPEEDYAYAQEHLRRCPQCASNSSRLLAECGQLLDRLKTMRDAPDNSTPEESDDDATQAVPGAARPPRYPEVAGYQIVGILGQGGMGIVYEAVQQKLNRRVALKLLPRVVGSAHRALVQRFRREATAAAKLHHSNIVPIYDFGESHAGYYYAMEILDGQSLGQIIKRVASFDTPIASPTEIAALVGVGETFSTEHLVGMGETTDSSGQRPPHVDTSSHSPSRSSTGKSRLYYYQVAKWVADIGDALHYAHLKGMIHRDVKPANIMVCRDGRVVLVDFGLVKESGDESVTMTGSLLGTYRYMSPEQIGAKRIRVDARTDVYSLGMTLYEMLTLQAAFTAVEQSELLGQILWREPVPPKKIAPSVPVDLQTICLKAVQKSPAERYASAGDMAEDLRQFLGDMPIKARPVGWMGRAARFLRRHPLATGLSSLILVLAVVLGFVAVLLDKEKARSDRERVDRIKAEGKQLAAEEQRINESLGKAWELGRNREWKRAAAAYREVLAEHPENVRALIQFAYLKKDQFYEDGDERQLEEGLALAERAILLDPARPGAWNAKIIALRELGRYPEALQACDLAPQEGSNAWAILVNKGGMLAAMGDLTSAEAVLTKSIRLAVEAEKNPGFLPWRNLAAIQLALSNPAAWDTLQEAQSHTSEVKPGILGLRAQMRLQLESQHDPELALDDAVAANQMVGENHRQADIIRALALARLRHGEYDRAAKAAQRALQISDGTDDYARLIQAVALARQGDVEEATRLRSLMKVRPSSTPSPQPGSCTLESRLLWCHTQADLDGLFQELSDILSTSNSSNP